MPEPEIVSGLPLDYPDGKLVLLEVSAGVIAMGTWRCLTLPPL